MRGAGVAQYAVGVEMLESLVRVFQKHGLGPRSEIFAGARHDVAHAVAALAVEVDVAFPQRIPESDVLRIEGTIGDSRFGRAARASESHRVMRKHRVPGRGANSQRP